MLLGKCRGNVFIIVLSIFTDQRKKNIELMEHMEFVIVSVLQIA